MVHRVVHQVLAGSGERYYLTIGDNCLAPDPPVSEHRVLGLVIAVETASGRRPPGSPQVKIGPAPDCTRHISIPASDVCHAPHQRIRRGAGRGMLFRRLEDMGRARVGRVLRFVGLLRGR